MFWLHNVLAPINSNFVVNAGVLAPASGEYAFTIITKVILDSSVYPVRVSGMSLDDCLSFCNYENLFPLFVSLYP